MYEYAVNMGDPVVSCDLLLRAVVGALRARGQVQESPNMAPFDVDAWLGAVFGEGMGCKLQDRQQRFLKRAYVDGDWDESDVPVQARMRSWGWHEMGARLSRKNSKRTTRSGSR